MPRRRWCDDITEHFPKDNLMIVSPDVGGVVRARGYARRLGADLAIVDKRRERAGESEVMNIIGDVEGRSCILVDDIVDSAGTLCNAAAALKKHGAKSVSAYVTHGVLSGGAVARVGLVRARKPRHHRQHRGHRRGAGSRNNIRRVSIAPLIGEAMRRISQETSVSSLFD